MPDSVVKQKVHLGLAVCISTQESLQQWHVVFQHVHCCMHLWFATPMVPRQPRFNFQGAAWSAGREVRKRQPWPKSERFLCRWDAIINPHTGFEKMRTSWSPTLGFTKRGSKNRSQKWIPKRGSKNRSQKWVPEVGSKNECVNNIIFPRLIAWFQKWGPKNRVQERVPKLGPKSEPQKWNPKMGVKN
jgi:hypothetical protein